MCKRAARYACTLLDMKCRRQDRGVLCRGSCFETGVVLDAAIAYFAGAANWCSCLARHARVGRCFGLGRVSHEKARCRLTLVTGNN
jgi:hypothetical protein